MQNKCNTISGQKPYIFNRSQEGAIFTVFIFKATIKCVFYIFTNNIQYDHNVRSFLTTETQKIEQENSASSKRYVLNYFLLLLVTKTIAPIVAKIADNEIEPVFTPGLKKLLFCGCS